ncbi:uncharacterized protein LOC116254691 isoform X1 [Nymphaea colorata]|nr:uncharacterized protein LOC116254691 isoform X1 [Nymphaea colorata]XP_049933942.1 uncharacterized protein LOC116254691 isoform X1 [Nymphaea colorata]XP_049933943.1 uncharacterized protein LOC116254691 isoform X1 [Nymphaea colorata]
MARTPEEAAMSFTFFTRSLSGPGSSFPEPSDKPSHPLPPCLEVPFSEDNTSIKHTVESIHLTGDLTLIKGDKERDFTTLAKESGMSNLILFFFLFEQCRVSTADVFGLANSDLVAGKYEGGLKLWEGSLDLVKTLHIHVEDGSLLLCGKRVLELGCGHGLPGIYACLKGAAAVHFQDFNVEVLRCLTVSNVKANLQKHLPETANDVCMPEVRFFAGDWTEVYQLFGCGNDSNLVSDPDFGYYDIILMAETVYSLSSLQSLYELIKKSLRRPNGIVYLAAKKYYFGVGGGTRDFRSIVENDGILESFLVAEFADGASNMRELWKFSFK